MAQEILVTGTGELFSKTSKNPLELYKSFKGIRQFIKLEQAFIKQLKECSETFDGQNSYLLREKMKISSEALLDCQPDKISLRLTEEGSVFYSLIKDEIKIYFQHFLIDEFDENDEAIISIINGNDNVMNYAGELTEVINQLGNFLASKNIAVRQFA
jgi:hypothetical protein